MKMYIYSAVLVVAVAIAVVDYTLKPKVVHSLECVLDQVIANQTGKVTNLEREEAIKMGYKYTINVYDDGSMLVNDEDRYIKEDKKENSYLLYLYGKPQPNLRFEFTENYDDVTFYIRKIDVKYEYNCAPN